MTEFQNSIAYGTFTNSGGAVTLTAGSYIQIPFGARKQATKILINIPPINLQLKY